MFLNKGKVPVYIGTKQKDRSCPFSKKFKQKSLHWFLELDTISKAGKSFVK